ncbi:MAG: MBL fold metallo-hydrolase [Armatimonadota bacterium]
MSIQFHVLGAPGRDNALLALVCTGQAVHRLLFDCGDGVLAPLPFAEIQRIDHLFFTHLHMDHVGGFDSFFRCTYNRTMKPNLVWGPARTAEILHHRFRGFLWNLHQDREASWRVADVDEQSVVWTRYELSEAFANPYPDEAGEFTGVLLDTPDFTVQAIHLEHLTPVLGYVVRESPRLNIDTTRLDELGLHPGPWLQAVKDAPAEQTHLEIEGKPYALADLRDNLLRKTPGDSVAYLTDFLLDKPAYKRLLPVLAGVKTLVCESAYREAELELARKNYHLTTRQAARLADQAGVGKLVLMHISDRYPMEEWGELLGEARDVFPNTVYPPSWGIEVR